jgi:serine/threonine-protein kinase
VNGNSILPRLRAIAQTRYDLDREDGADGAFVRVLARDRDRGGAAVVLRVAPEGSGPSLGRIALARALAHPHVLEITDHGEAAGFLFYATPLVARGVTLRTWLSRETRLPILESVRVLRETALAIEHAHARGVVHGALRPECVLWVDTHVRVDGFSFAPEVERREDDVRALGRIGYETLTGRAESPADGPLPPVNALRHHLPPGLAFLVMRCLGDEPPETSEVARVLRGLVTPAPGYEAMQLVRQARYLLDAGDAAGAFDRFRRAAAAAPGLAAAESGVAEVAARLEG